MMSTPAITSSPARSQWFKKDGPPAEQIKQIRDWLRSVETESSDRRFAAARLQELEPSLLESLPLTDPERSTIHEIRVSENLRDAIENGFESCGNVFGRPRHFDMLCREQEAVRLWMRAFRAALPESALNRVSEAFDRHIQQGVAFPKPVHIIRIAKSLHADSQKGRQ